MYVTDALSTENKIQCGFWGGATSAAKEYPGNPQDTIALIAKIAKRIRKYSLQINNDGTPTLSASWAKTVPIWVSGEVITVA